MDKKITISANLDTKQFDQSIKDLQNKLAQIQQNNFKTPDLAKTQQNLSKQGLPLLSPQSEENSKRNLLTLTKELDNFLKSQVSSENKIAQAIDNRIKKLEQLKKLNQDDLKTDQQRLKLKEDIVKNEESLNRLASISTAKKTAITEALTVKEKLTPKFDKVMPEPVRKDAIQDKLQAMATPAAIAKIAAMALDTAEYVASSNRRIASATGAAIQAQSQVAESAFQGTLGKQMYFRQERTQAATRTAKEEKTDRAIDSIRAIGAIAVPLVAGALALTGVGAPLAMAGLAGVAMMTGGNVAKQKLTGTYESEREKVQAERTEQYTQDLIKAQFLRRKGIETFENNAEDNLAIQRQLGMGTAQFYGRGQYGQGGKLQGQDLLGRGRQAGFTRDLTLNATQQIMQAGGTSQGAAENATVSNTLQRQFNLTNASQILGKLTGGGIGASEGKDATLRILTEGVRVGFDTSKTPELLRSFSSSVAEIANQIGVTSQVGVSNIAAQMASFQTDKTTRGVEAAQSAYQTWQKTSADTTGAVGAIKFNKIRQQYGNDLSFAEQQSLAELSDSDLERKGPTIQKLAQKRGVSVDDMVAEIRGIHQESTEALGGGAKLGKTLRAKYAESQKAGISDEDFQAKNAADLSAYGAQSELLLGQAYNPNTIQGQALLMSRIRGGGMGGKGGISGGVAGQYTEFDDLQKKYAGKNIPWSPEDLAKVKPEDLRRGAAAKGEEAMGYAVNAQLEEATKSYSEVMQSTREEIIKLVDVQAKGVDGIAEYQKALENLHNRITGMTSEVNKDISQRNAEVAQAMGAVPRSARYTGPAIRQPSAGHNRQNK